jgi:hypothetical protein
MGTGSRFLCNGKAGDGFGEKGVVIEREELDIAVDYKRVSWHTRAADSKDHT